MNIKFLAIMLAVLAIVAFSGCIQPSEEKPSGTPTPSESPAKATDEKLAEEIAASMETPSELAGLDELEVDLNELEELASELTETEDIAESGIDESTFE